ncbi:VTT domain-containing protein [Candidatus Giovannonibacteria bacterium]|nr:VTT domain-containing protein [Candidatus Giovannonibacteria bacterium]
MESLIPLLLKYKYLILFPIAAFEGPVVAFTAGFLVSQGYLNFFITYVILIFGDIIPDSTYYSLGRFAEGNAFASKYARKIGLTPRRLEAMKKLWHKHTAKTMIITKLAYGLSTPLLIASGYAKIPFKKFITYSTLQSLVQYAIFLFLGFYFGNSYDLIFKYFNNVQMIVAAAVIIFAIIYYAGTITLKKVIAKKEKLNNENSDLH